MTNSLLCSLTRSIDAGRPLNALLRAAEYCDGDNPVFNSLAARAGHLLRHRKYSPIKNLLTLVLNGQKLSSFSESEQAKLLSIKEAAGVSNRISTPIVMSLRLSRIPNHLRRQSERRGPGIDRRITDNNTRSRFPHGVPAIVHSFGSAR